MATVMTSIKGGQGPQDAPDGSRLGDPLASTSFPVDIPTSGSRTTERPETRNGSSAAAQGSLSSSLNKATNAGGSNRISRSSPIQPSGSRNASAALSSSPSGASVDPLSQHIFLRTNTDLSRSSRLRNHTSRPDSPVPDGLVQSGADGLTKFPPLPAEVKDKKKRFLGRLSMRGNWRKDDFSDKGSDYGEPRTEGSNAQVFSTFVEAGGFIPVHKEPPRYIRVKSHNKKVKEFDRMFLAQELIGTRPRKTNPNDKTPLVTVTTASQGRKREMTGGAVWATEFSKDGRYFAAGGRDNVVRVWEVIATAENRRTQEAEEAEESGGAMTERLSAPVFMEKPIREYEGHTGEILDLSWSKNNFLLSTSMDKTVRLWHISRTECLCAFKHKEFVSKVAFHPRDDRFFLAGCLDATLRLWSIPDKNIAYSAELPDMITAVAFSPDGKTTIAGLLNGYCHFFDTEKLKPQTQILVRSSRGRNTKGSKITGIVTMQPVSSRDPGEARVLVTSTDARIRVYSLRDKTLEAKFKGHDHTSIQLAASFSDDGKYIVCGSEDRKAFIWNMTGPFIDTDKRPCECFDAHSDMVTTAIFAPTKTRQLLGASGDPIYDLCNPPPVQLMSVEESMASQSVRSDQTAHLEEGMSPVTVTSPTATATPTTPKPRPEESPAYIARSTHYDGNIIITSDDTGIIKVFRQDCAAVKRRHESWETGSSFSRKLTANSGLVGRAGSIITRNSTSSAAHSRRGSISQPLFAGGSGNLANTQMGSSDRILSWRQDIESGGPSSLAGALRTERSLSPNKGRIPAGAGLPGDMRKPPFTATSSPLSPHFVGRTGVAGAGVAGAGVAGAGVAGAGVTGAGVAGAGVTGTAGAGAAGTTDTAGAGLGTTTTPTTDRPTEEQTVEPAPAQKDETEKTADQPNDGFGPPAPSFSFKPNEDDDPLRLDPAGASYSFWNLNKWKGISSLRASLLGTVSNSSTNNANNNTNTTTATNNNNNNNNNANNATTTKNETHDETSHSVHNGIGSLHRRLSFGSSILPKAWTGEGGAEGGVVSGVGAGSAPAGASSGDLNAVVRASQGARRVSTGGSRLTPALTVTSTDDAQRPKEDHDHEHEHGHEHEHEHDHHYLRHLLRPPTRDRSPLSPSGRDGSILSRLSSELTSSDGDVDGDGDGEGGGNGNGRGSSSHGGGGGGNSEGAEMQCPKCGSKEFKARRISGGQQRLHCSRCGKAVE